VADTPERIQGGADRLRIHVAHQLADVLQLTAAWRSWEVIR
jgi:hypothetical protein